MRTRLMCPFSLLPSTRPFSYTFHLNSVNSFRFPLFSIIFLFFSIFIFYLFYFIHSGRIYQLQFCLISSTLRPRFKVSSSLSASSTLRALVRDNFNLTPFFFLLIYNKFVEIRVEKTFPRKREFLPDI